MNMKLHVLFCVVISNKVFCESRKLIVKTSTGLVRGKLNHYNEFSYYSYQGIPYAENPSGKKRFQPPTPKRPWNDVLDATKNGVVCPQWEHPYKYEQMSEDCLLLNVYVPARAAPQLPVFVFLHGGGLASLSGGSDYLYGPQFLLQQELIVVTLNFRLGPLGFLSLGIDEASGNAGIKDIILALKWIKQNLSKFGGDCGKITLGGQSSGAALVHYLMFTKQTHELFHRAILMSGSALNHRFMSLHPTDNALSLANELGIKSKDPHVVLGQLQQVNVFDIVQAFKNISSADTNVLKPCNFFAPCIEKKNSHAVITENPILILEKSIIPQNIPVMVGVNGQEGIYMIPNFLSHPNELENMRNNHELYIPSNIEYPKGSQEATQLGNSISEKYFNNTNFYIDKLINLASDIRYNYNVFAWIKLHKRNPKSNTLYFYTFDFDGDLNWSKLNYNIDYPGTSHTDEIGYLFVTNRTLNLIKKASIESKRMINVTVSLFSNFIKNGTPQASGNNKWPEFNIRDQKYFLINPDPSEQTLLNNSTIINFWDNVYYQFKQYKNNGGTLQNKCQIKSVN